MNDVVLVQLAPNGALYSYFNHDPTVVETDLVVVALEGQLTQFTPYRVGVVKDTNPIEAARKRATKWIVCKIDLDTHTALTAMTPKPKPTSQKSTANHAANAALRKYRQAKKV